MYDIKKENQKEKQKRKNKRRIKKTKNFLTNEINILVLSSLIFITNMTTAFIYKKYIYSFLFLLLTITSVIYHSNANIYTHILDKIVIAFVVSYGAYKLYNKAQKKNYIFVVIVLLLFLLTIFLYIYGYFIKQFCFHNDKRIGSRYHCFLHCISSLAHHMIIII
jgi:hypothetical protein